MSGKQYKYNVYNRATGNWDTYHFETDVEMVEGLADTITKKVAADLNTDSEIFEDKRLGVESTKNHLGYSASEAYEHDEYEYYTDFTSAPSGRFLVHFNDYGIGDPENLPYNKSGYASIYSLKITRNAEEYPIYEYAFTGSEYEWRAIYQVRFDCYYLLVKATVDDTECYKIMAIIPYDFFRFSAGESLVGSTDLPQVWFGITPYGAVASWEYDNPNYTGEDDGIPQYINTSVYLHPQEIAAGRSLYVTCSTSAATAAKTATTDSGNFVLFKSARVIVRFTVTNSAANPTLSIDGCEAKAIYYRNAAITAGYLAANRVLEFVYTGSVWELIGGNIS